MGFGYEEGSTCGRNGCAGKIELHEVENCSCHISPPCYEHSKPRAFCPECEWEEADDYIINDYIVSVNKVMVSKSKVSCRCVYQLKPEVLQLPKYLSVRVWIRVWIRARYRLMMKFVNTLELN